VGVDGDACDVCAVFVVGGGGEAGEVKLGGGGFGVDVLVFGKGGR